MSTDLPDPRFRVGDAVRKTGGDYRFEGTVVAAFHKRGGLARYVVEDDRGLLFLFSDRNLEPRDADPVLDVHVCREVPSGQWAVWVRKAGRRVCLGRWPRDVLHPAEGQARELAAFLGVPCVVERDRDQPPVEESPDV